MIAVGADPSFPSVATSNTASPLFKSANGVCRHAGQYLGKQDRQQVADNREDGRTTTRRRRLARVASPCTLPHAGSLAGSGAACPSRCRTPAALPVFGEPLVFGALCPGAALAPGKLPPFRQRRFPWRGTVAVFEACESAGPTVTWLSWSPISNGDSCYSQHRLTPRSPAISRNAPETMACAVNSDPSSFWFPARALVSRPDLVDSAWLGVFEFHRIRCVAANGCGRRNVDHYRLASAIKELWIVMVLAAVLISFTSPPTPVPPFVPLLLLLLRDISSSSSPARTKPRESCLAGLTSRQRPVPNLNVGDLRSREQT